MEIIHAVVGGSDSRAVGNTFDAGYTLAEVWFEAVTLMLVRRIGSAFCVIPQRALTEQQPSHFQLVEAGEGALHWDRPRSPFEWPGAGEQQPLLASQYS